MKHQRGVALSGLLFWGVIVILVAVLGMKVTPTVIEYFTIVKTSKTVVAQASPEATVADIRRAFDKYGEVGYLEFKANQLDVFKDPAGRIVISFAYEKRIPLFANVSLLIEYEGSTAK